MVTAALIALLLIGIFMTIGGALFSVGAAQRDSVSNETMATGRRGWAWVIAGLALVCFATWRLGA